VAADDRLQRHLDGEVEVLGEERLDRLDHLAPVGLEGVGGVVVAVAEEEADELVGEAVEDVLEARVVVDAGAGHEAGAEGAVPALFQQPVVADEVVGIVGGVGHHDRDGVPLEDVESGPDRVAEAAFEVGTVDADARVALADRGDDGFGRVFRVVVDDDHLVVDRFAFQRRDHSFDGPPDRALLVLGRNHHRELHPLRHEAATLPEVTELPRSRAPGFCSYASPVAAKTLR
jgi:hypothetical protein